MKHGDFTELAKFYGNRVGYSKTLLSYIMGYVQLNCGENIVVADVGAGTGKLTENLYELGLQGYAVEPNDAMRAEGIQVFKNKKGFEWKVGSAEQTGLADESVNWVLMGSSFHWTDGPRAIAEFRRILKTGGVFTAIWNPRDIERSELHLEIEDIIYKEMPGMKRVSSARKMTTTQILEKMGDMNLEVVHLEAQHNEKMSKERYMNIWRSVNDIRVQAGEEKFERIMCNIESKLEGMDEIEVPYLSRAWSVRLK